MACSTCFGFVRLPLQCDKCHKRIWGFDLTNDSLVAIVVDVRLYQPKEIGETMTATKLQNGAWEISAMISDPIAKSFAWSREIGERLMTRVYYGYTKREALALFKAQVIEQGFKIAK